MSSEWGRDFTQNANRGVTRCHGVTRKNALTCDDANWCHVGSHHDTPVESLIIPWSQVRVLPAPPVLMARQPALQG
jgi:hypothetical protein